MSPITVDDALLDGLQAKAEAATPGDWEAENAALFACDIIEWGKGEDRLGSPKPDTRYFDGVSAKKPNGCGNTVCGCWQVEDAAFIAAANPAVIAALVREVRVWQRATFELAKLSDIEGGEGSGSWMAWAEDKARAALEQPK